MNNNLDKINMKWHGIQLEDLEGGKIQEDIDRYSKDL